MLSPNCSMHWDRHFLYIGLRLERRRQDVIGCTQTNPWGGEHAVDNNPVTPVYGQ
jgi:hypothetical protein